MTLSENEGSVTQLVKEIQNCGKYMLRSLLLSTLSCL